MWESLGNVGFISVSKWPELDEGCIDEKFEKLEYFVGQTVEDIKNILKIVGKKPKKVNVYVAPEWKHTAYNCILEYAKDPEKIIPSLMKNPELRKYGNELVRFAERLKKEEMAKLGKIPDEKEEFVALKEAKEAIEKEIGCKVEIIEAVKSGSEKARRAEPGKPGIEIVV
jgi:leucyl-tRNA synthetase